MPKLTNTASLTDEKLHALLPHRAPMLLLNKFLAVDAKSSAALALVDEQSLFYIPEQGIPAWTGIEFMGQTAALIAGYQQQQGSLPSHTGFLVGSRRYASSIGWFTPGSVLLLQCTELAVVGEGLANFECTLSAFENETLDSVALRFQNDDTIQLTSQHSVATASLTVFRKPDTNPENVVTLNE